MLIKILNSLLTASLCKKLTVDSIYPDRVIGIMKLMALLPSNGIHHHLFVLSMCLDVHYDLCLHQLTCYTLSIAIFFLDFVKPTICITLIPLFSKSCFLAIKSIIYHTVIDGFFC